MSHFNFFRNKLSLCILFITYLFFIYLWEIILFAVVFLLFFMLSFQGKLSQKYLMTLRNVIFVFYFLVCACVRACACTSSPSSAQCFILGVCVPEEAEQSSGVAHSTLSHTVAPRWKRSLLHARERALTVWPLTAKCFFRCVVSSHCRLWAAVVCLCVRPVLWHPWWADAAGVCRPSAGLISNLPLSALSSSSCRSRWGRNDHKMALNSGKMTADWTSSTWANQFTPLS